MVEQKGCVIECSNFALPEENTLATAYKAFTEITGIVPGIQVQLKKGIPSGGGLGGGSSDAAALVRVLERVSGKKLSDTELDYIAARTGSDVFFFMHCDSEGKGCALVSGRGEKVEKILTRNDLFLLLLFPEVSSSTKEAYAAIDRENEQGNVQTDPSFSDLERMYRKSPKEWKFKNTFTPVLCKRYDVIEAALNDLKKSSAEYVEMSGSGSTIFGVFTNRLEAESCFRTLSKMRKCELVQTV